MSKTQRNILFSFAGVLAVCLAALATLYLSAFLFLASNKVNPLNARVDSFPIYWSAYKSDARLRKRMQGCAGLAAALCFLIVPLSISIIASRQKRRPLHGDARFATLAELRKTGLLKSSGPSILLGKYGPKYLGLGGQSFVLLAAPTRSGKGVGVVIPNLLNWPDSVMCLDIKGELFERTAGFRAKHAQRVYAFRPFDEHGRTHRYNPLAHVRRSERYRVGDLQTIATAFYPTAGKGDSGSTEKFFNEKARDLFLGLALYLYETPSLPFTLGELLRQSSGKGKPLREHLQALIAERDQNAQPLSDDCVDALDRFISNSDNTLSSILATFNAPLNIFADPLVDAATSASDFDLSEVRSQRISVYLVVPPGKLDVCGLLVNLLFSQLIELNTRELPEHNSRLRYQCLLLMDEFTSMGRVGVLAKGVSFLAGYNLRFLTIIQSMSQLASVYGEKDARTFAINHSLQILFAPEDQSDAREYSELLGTFTEKVESHSRSRQIMGSKGSSVSTNVSDQKRALMLPQELREMDPAHEIVMMSSSKPILAEKIRYYDDESFKDRLLPPPELPIVDLDLHLARVQGRKRPVTADDVVHGIDLSKLAHNFDSLPELPVSASSAEVSAFVDSFFDAVGVAADAAPHSVSEQPNFIELSEPQAGDPEDTNPDLPEQVDLAVLDR